jgi:hypothetical protein
MISGPRIRRGRVALLVLSATAAVVLNGCAWFGRTNPPGWIEGTSQEYGPDRYLIGVGQAESQPEAASRAYAAVSRIFKAEIRAQSKDWESFLVLEKRGTASTERRLTLDQVTNVSTDKVLDNVRLLDAWKDPRTGRHYALAGMDRVQAGAAMQERVGELDHELQGDVEQSRQTQDRLTAVRHLRRALKNLVLREAYNADLRVIRTSGQGIEPPYRVAELTTQLEQVMAANLVIGVAVAGDQAEAVRRAVMEGLVREGLPVTAGRIVGEALSGSGGEVPPLELLIKGTVRLWALSVPDPRFKYARWCSDFVIVEGATKRVVGAVSRGGREGHLTEAEALAKAGRVMQQEVISDLAKTLAGYIYGDAMPVAVSPPSACVVGARDG